MSSTPEENRKEIDIDEQSLVKRIARTIYLYTILFSLEYSGVRGHMSPDEWKVTKDFRRMAKRSKDKIDLVQYKEDIDEITEQNKIMLADFIREIDDAEAAITSLHYNNMNNEESVFDIEAETIDDLMIYSPALMARRINRLSKHKELDEKCREFIALKNKAKLLYDKAIQEQDAIVSEYVSRALRMLFDSYKADMISAAPPQLIIDFVNGLKIRGNISSKDFSPANNEPFNVTVGVMAMDFSLTNDEARNFLLDQYKSIFMSYDKYSLMFFPYTIALDENFALCYKYNSSEMELVQEDMQHLCMSIFLATPPGKMRFCFIDPLRMGHSFAVFNNFEDNNNASVNVIMGGRTLTEKENIERQLKILVGSINTIVSMTFKGEYKNIREYNEANPLAPQPYHILGIMDFPAGFTAESLDLLEKILTEGKRCGIYVIIMMNETQASDTAQHIRGRIKAIEQKCMCFKLNAERKGYTKILDSDEPPSLDDSIYRDIEENAVYVFSQKLDIQDILKIAPIMKQAIKDAERITIEYENIMPSEEAILNTSIDEGIAIPIGLSSTRDILALELGRPRSQSVHALICGQIGSGKSRLLHAIITGALLKYPKEELEIYLVDFKSGTEFKVYADYNLPSLKVLALESEPEFGLSVLRALRAEKERRAQAFNANSVEDLPSYNKTAEARKNGKLPRILIVIDEFHVLFSGTDSMIRNEAMMLLDDILRLDRNAGFHVVLCSQSIRGMNAITEAALAQIAVRIALKCPDEDANIVLGNEAKAMDQIEENDAGSAIYVPAISSPRSVKFRVGLLRREKQSELLKMIDGIYTGKGQIATTRVLASNVYDNRNSIFQRYFTGGELAVQNRVIHVGEPLKVNASLEIRFSAEAANNLLLIGKSIQKAQNILFFAALDLVLQRLKQIRNGISPANIYILNYCDGADIGFNDILERLGANLTSYVNYYNGASAKKGLEEIYRRFMDKTPDMPDDWLILSNMALASDIQSSSIYGSYRENANRFKQLLQEGPSKGVFTLAWCDDPAIFRAKFSSTYEDFGKQIVFNVSPEDALSLANIVNDDSISRNNAYLHQEGRATEKFRPYSTPIEKWLVSMIARLKADSCE